MITSLVRNQTIISGSEVSNPESYTTLDKLSGSHEAVVIGIEGHPGLRRRLMEAGFVNRSSVHFLMATPFGDPLIFSLRGTSIALRKIEARCIRVRY